MATPQEIIDEIKALRIELNTYKGQANSLVEIIKTRKEQLVVVQDNVKETSKQIDVKFKELRSLI